MEIMCINLQNSNIPTTLFYILDLQISLFYSVMFSINYFNQLCQLRFIFHDTHRTKKKIPDQGLSPGHFIRSASGGYCLVILCYELLAGFLWSLLLWGVFRPQHSPRCCLGKSERGAKAPRRSDKRGLVWWPLRRTIKCCLVDYYWRKMHYKLGDKPQRHNTDPMVEPARSSKTPITGWEERGWRASGEEGWKNEFH